MRIMFTSYVFALVIYLCIYYVQYQLDVFLTNKLSIYFFDFPG